MAADWKVQRQRSARLLHGKKTRVFDAWLRRVKHVVSVKQRLAEQRRMRLQRSVFKPFAKYIAKVLRVKRFVLQRIAGQKLRRLLRWQYFVASEKSSLRLQCWTRCILAQRVAFRLRRARFARRVCAAAVAMAESRVSRIIRFRAARTIQTRFRTYAERHTLRHRQDLRHEEFHAYLRNWETMLHGAAQATLRTKLHQLNSSSKTRSSCIAHARREPLLCALCFTPPGAPDVGPPIESKTRSMITRWSKCSMLWMSSAPSCSHEQLWPVLCVWAYGQARLPASVESQRAYWLGVMTRFPVRP